MVSECGRCLDGEETLEYLPFMSIVSVNTAIYDNEFYFWLIHYLHYMYGYFKVISNL